MSISLQVQPQQITRTGGFELPCSADVAFPLFSPEGERDWIKEWNPRPIVPETIVFARDTIFREGDGEAEAVWTIVDADWKTHRAEYVRVAPASHAGHITVNVEAVGIGNSHVTVRYTITTLGERASALLEAFSEAAFTMKMSRWQRQITEYLQNGPPL